LDEQYQRQRREAINRRPADLKEGLAQGGKSLVMVNDDWRYFIVPLLFTHGTISNF